MISIQNLGKKFEGQWVFQNLNLQITTGERVVIMGPSGTGKSLLLKLAAGLIQPDTGSVQMSSSKISMIFQKNALFDSLTVQENLLLPLKENMHITGELASRKAQGFLKAVGLHGTEALYPDELSGGMQKRLGIARALITEPEILFYDEPTAGLDPITARQISNLILKIQQEKQSTLCVVTNDLMRAYQLGSRIVLLAKGNLFVGGTPHETQKSKNPVIRQFIEGLEKGPLTSETT